MGSLLVLLLIGTIGCDPQDLTREEDEEELEGEVYRNPVLNRDFPDPSVFQGPDSTYYAYATETVVDGSFYNIQVAQSQTLVDWSWEGDAFPSGVSWAEESRSYWAPHVIYAAEQDRYLMYYSAHHDERDGKCLSVAAAEEPLGPFTDEGEPLICGEGFEHIDPMAFDDPESGKKYLYWGSYGQPIRVQELAEDRMHFKPGTESTPVLSPAPDEPYGDLIEGAWVVYHNDTYFLYYSGDNCCGENANYAVMVARADAPTGPFERLSSVEGTGRSTILTANGTWNATGHNSVVEDAAGTDWMMYHAIDRDRPTQPNGWDRRVMLMDRIQYEGGWPRIEAASPSSEAKVPTVD